MPHQAIVLVTLTQLSTCIRNDGHGSDHCERLYFLPAYEQNSKPQALQALVVLITVPPAPPRPGLP
jgi:hypothetical protein